METTNYGYGKTVTYAFDQAIEATTQALQTQGFGILTTIDVQAKMKEKLGKDMDRYVILGACSPSSAFEAIQAEETIGLLLPCNVIVYQKNSEVIVSAMLPSVAMGFISNRKLHCIVQKIEPRLKAAIDVLS